MVRPNPAKTMSARGPKLRTASKKSVSTAITTRDKRELLEHYELLGDQKRQLLRTGGLFCSLDLLQTLLRLFWDLNTRLEQLDEEHNAWVSEIDKLPKGETVWPDVATSELMVATLALEEVLKTIGEEHSLPKRLSASTMLFWHLFMMPRPPVC